VTPAKFKFCKKSSSLKVSGENFEIKNLENFLDLLIELDKKKYEKINIYGNFNTEISMHNIASKKNKKNEIKNLLTLFQSITNTIENSVIFYTSSVKNLVRGPALEIALSCNFIKADKNTYFKFDEVNKGLMPLFGSIQRLIRLMGYKETLEILLVKRFLSYEKALNYKLINQNIDNRKTIMKKKIDWDEAFTNTFIYFNAKTHAKHKSNIMPFQAILSSIFEGSICDYKASLIIEKKWLEWLICNNFYKDNIFN